MELGVKNYRTVSLLFAVVILFVGMFNSCTNQRSLAQDTIKVPKALRPSSQIHASQLHAAQNENKALQKQLNPLQKQLQQDLPNVINRSQKAFGEITDIKSMLTYMNENSIAERDLFLDRARQLRVLNDTLVAQQMVSNKSINRLISIVLSERDARIANEKRTEDDRKLNISNIKAQNLYTGILFAFLVALLIILSLQWLDIRRIKAKYKSQLQDG